MTMGNRDTHEILAYHEATKHSPQSVRASHYTLDWENRPLSWRLARLALARQQTRRRALLGGRAAKAG